MRKNYSPGILGAKMIRDFFLNVVQPAMTIPFRFRAAFYLSLFAMLLTFVMIVWGGMVKNTGSSMACPDWPLCRGQIMPDTSELPASDARGIFWEHGHRTIGTVIGLSVIILCLLLWKVHPSGLSLRSGPLTLLPLVIFQGVLGAITVKLHISGVVSTIHLGTSMLVLILMIRLCRRIAFANCRLLQLPELTADPQTVERARRTLGFAVAVVFIQILLGATVRHLGASLTAGYGWQFSFIGMDPATANHTFWPSGAPAQLNYLHRYFAFVTAGVVFFAAIRGWSLLGEKLPVHAAFPLVLPVGLVLFQILAGVLMLGLWVDQEILVRTLHLAIGTLLLAVQANAWMQVGELRKFDNKGRIYGASA